jgi:hypothetical protein
MSNSGLPAWIYPGAKVLFVTTTPGALAKTVRREVVQRTTKTQIVLTNTDTRIRIDNLHGVGEQPYGNSYTLLDPQSEQGIVAWECEQVRRIKAQARDAARTWAHGDLTDTDALDKAILSLTRWSETLKATPKEFL